MERYMPTLKDLAPRDIVSRCIVQEIKDGNGVDGKDYVYLDVRHLGAEKIAEKLPDITDFARNYLGVEPITEPVPIQPTAHYAMGGISTDTGCSRRDRSSMDTNARLLCRWRSSLCLCRWTNRLVQTRW